MYWRPETGGRLCNISFVPQGSRGSWWCDLRKYAHREDERVGVTLHKGIKNGRKKD